MKNKLEKQKKKDKIFLKNEKSKSLKKGIVLFFVRRRKRITFIVD